MKKKTIKNLRAKLICIFLIIIVLFFAIWTLVFGSPPVVLIKFTPYLTNRTELSLSNINDFDAISLKYMKRLKNLSVSGKITDISFLNEMDSLEDLWISNYESGAVIEDWTPISNCKELKTYMGVSTGIDNLSSFKELTQLYNIILWEKPTLSDISDIQYLTSLESVSIIGENVSDISALSELKNLKSISIQGTSISDISSLHKLPKLERLSLAYCPYLRDIKEIRNCKNLKYLDLININAYDYSMLQEIPNLEIHIEPGR